MYIYFVPDTYCYIAIYRQRILRSKTNNKATKHFSNKIKKPL